MARQVSQARQATKATHHRRRQNLPLSTADHPAPTPTLALARSLLGLGADPGIRDQRFDSTPLGWARYFGQEELVALLEPLTAPEEA